MNAHQWQIHVDAFEQSGLSKVAFTKQTGINYNQFLYWYRKLSKEHSERNGFVPVSVKPDDALDERSVEQPTSQTDNCLGVLEFPSGLRLHIHDAELLSMLPASLL